MNAQIGSPAVAELGLGAVLADALPPTLLTPDAPERYTVSAVFTRRPTRPEIVAIQGPETRDTLSRAGYSTVEVHVSDRRLEVSNTNLAELSSGLAEVIAVRLHEIGLRALADHDRFAAELREASVRETDRSALVALAAAAVTFALPRGGTSPESDWEEEGGSTVAWFDVNNEGPATRYRSHCLPNRRMVQQSGPDPARRLSRRGPTRRLSRTSPALASIEQRRDNVDVLVTAQRRQHCI